MPHRPLIALADPQWIGHRETYFREFVLSLQRNGADVAALCPKPERIQAAVDSSGWRDADGAKLFTAELKEPKRSPLLKRLPHDPITTRQRWQATLTALRKAEEAAGRPAAFLFLPWLDDYLRASLTEGWAQSGLRCPWAGLYFRPYHLLQRESPGMKAAMRGWSKGDDLLKSPSCAAISVLDETLEPVFAKVFGKPVIEFPDITDESAPDPQQAFATEIRRVAKGRKVIGLIGLEKRKGVVTMLRAAELAKKAGKPWLFVFAGGLNFWEFSPEEKELFQRNMDSSKSGDPNGNVLFQEKLAPIPDGSGFNGVMDTFDVLFTAYHDFLGSSNVLTKAALLQKPVVSTRYGCIGTRTETYALGLTIPQGDAAACCEAIEHAINGTNWDGTKQERRFDAYHQRHNRERLDAAMGELLSLVIPDKIQKQAPEPVLT